ncbi:coiled-coil domain-containing protein [Aspergillus tubingensis]|uniref:coiled-coil domain-containing protein n=1 Tax=Aspergillus tubingensis TaxID=5068 RepID=UPI001579B7AB|nr:cleavage and polyadenylation specifity factor, 73 kDa subunit [Aspergillus tubingensis]GFN15992.1 cleavage and polyadenylation specifity factor, 73 kDa subunit [Aspergillus tubingensis]
MVAATKRSLSEFLEGDELFVEAERDEMITVIHSEVDQLRKDIEKLGVELAGTKQELAGTKQELSEFQQELAGIEQRLAESQHASDQFGLQARAQFSNGFIDIRDRFLSSFRRDVLNDTAVETQRLIRIGNVRAHGGHFKADASFYEEDSRYLDEGGKIHPPRNDRDTFVLLYGVDPSLAKKIDYIPIINVIERHATVKASEKRIGIDLFEERFYKFLDALVSAGYAGDYLDPMQADAQHNELHEAYKAFWVASRLVR